MIYYDASYLLNKGALYNIVLSDRSDGKTFNCKYRALKRYLEKKEQTVYMRRWKTEFSKSMIETFMDEIQRVYPEYEHLKFKGDKSGIYIEEAPKKWKRFIVFIPLSVSARLKSSFDPIPIAEIDFDEYVPLDGRYIQDEMNILNEFYMSCDRKRSKVQLLLQGNRISNYIPFLQFYNIRVTINKKTLRTYKNGTVALQLFYEDENRKEIEDSTYGKLIKGTDYGKYIYGDTLTGGSVNLQEMPEGANPICSFKSVAGEGTIWSYDRCMYISEQTRKDLLVCCDKVYDIKDRECFIADYGTLRLVIESCYKTNRLFAESIQAMNKFNPILKIMISRIQY